MSSGPKLLLIDGNNMCHRLFWAARTRQKGKKGEGDGLTYKGRCVEVIYGFFRQLIHLHKRYPDYFPIIAWDAGYTRRLEESQAAVAAGLIPSAYKSTRPKRGEVNDDPDAIDMEPLFEQMEELQVNGLNWVRCLQVMIPGVEADDILHTYARTYADWDGRSVIISSDGDFYQVIDDNTTLYHPVKKELWTKERFTMEFGFAPYLWVDAGAIIGEIGKSKDNIFGVDGWGPTTACKYVREHGDIDAIKAVIEAKPEKKRGKRERDFLEQWERLLLAWSLKKMDMLPDLPKPRCPPRDEKAVRKYFLEWSFASILKEAWRLV